MNKNIMVWIDIAISDLESSQLLYKNEKFRTSYFLFQQSAEKANKVLALIDGRLNEREIKNIKHDQLKIYRKLITQQKEKTRTLLQVLEQFPEVANHNILTKTNFTKHQETISNSIRFIDDLRNEDLVNITSIELNTMLRQLKQAKIIKLNIPKNYEKKFKELMFELADMVGQFRTQVAIEKKRELIDFLNDKEQSTQLYNVIAKDVIPIMTDLNFISLTLYYCAIITVQHSSLSRYPYNGSNPEDIYQKRLPLIKKQPEFMNLLNEALNKLKSINSIL